MGTNVSHPVHRCLNLRLNLIGHIPINSSEPQEHKMTFAKANPSSVELKFCLMRLIPVGLSTNTYTCPYQGWPFQAVKQLELKLNRILCIFLFCTVFFWYFIFQLNAKQIRTTVKMEELVSQMRWQFGAPVGNVFQDQNVKTKQVIYRCMFIYVVCMVIKKVPFWRCMSYLTGKEYRVRCQINRQFLWCFFLKNYRH